MSIRPAPLPENDDPVPPYLSPGVIAEACRLSWKSTLTELKGAARAEEQRSKRPSRLLAWHPQDPTNPAAGGRWRVSSSRLQELLPDMYDRVFAHYSRHVGPFAVPRRSSPVLAGTRR